MSFLINDSQKIHDIGLLVLRIGIGVVYFFHGYPKMAGGPELWAGVGSAVSKFGINFGFEFWGFMAAFAEMIGGILIVLGLFLRPAAILLLLTMITAFNMHVQNGDPFGVYSNSLKGLAAALGLAFTGPGKYSLDYLLFHKKQEYIS